MVSSWWTSLLFLAAGSLVGATKVLRMISWNVGDNSKMDGGLFPEALDELLGIPHNKDLADIYVVGLQENCWQCNFDNMKNIPQAFFNRLKTYGDLEIVGIRGTRESKDCELECKTKGNHGTTALLAIASKGLVVKHVGGRHISGCSDKIPANHEKGVAYMRLTLSTGQSVCVMTSHLESRQPKMRRQCLNNFFKDAEQNMGWSSGCDFHFLSGDFNTRTAAAAPKDQKDYLPQGTELGPLKKVDEMCGSNPFGQDADWKGNLLSFINSVQKNVYKESPFQFLPTYSLNKEKGSCEGKFPCYRTNRPMSWTDRILHTRGKSLKYDSIYLDKSDHLPVFEEFQLS